MRPRPAMFTWLDGHMVPHQRFAEICRRQFADGEDYALEVVQNRSMASHNQYFAALNDGWLNLSEESAKHFPTSEHLRHWALIQTGFGTEKDYVFDTARDAKAFAIALRDSDEYAVIVPKGSVVKVLRAKSQAIPAMRKEVFEESKKAVLDLVATMARTTRAELNQHGGRSA